MTAPTHTAVPSTLDGCTRRYRRDGEPRATATATGDAVPTQAKPRAERDADRIADGNRGRARPTIEGPITGPGNPFIQSTDVRPRRGRLLAAGVLHLRHGARLRQPRRARLRTVSGASPPAPSAAYKTRIMVYRPIDAQQLQRLGDRRMAQRQRRPRRRAGLDARAHGADPRRVCLGRRLGPVRRRRRARRAGTDPGLAGSQSQRRQHGALRIAPPSRRHLLVRHVLAGRRRRFATRPASTRSTACRSSG